MIFLVKRILNYFGFLNKDNESLVSKKNLLVKSSLSNKNTTISAYNILVKSRFDRNIMCLKNEK